MMPTPRGAGANRGARRAVNPTANAGIVNELINRATSGINIPADGSPPLPSESSSENTSTNSSREPSPREVPREPSENRLAAHSTRLRNVETSVLQLKTTVENYPAIQAELRAHTERAIEQAKRDNETLNALITEIRANLAINSTRVTEVSQQSTALGATVQETTEKIAAVEIQSAANRDDIRQHKVLIDNVTARSVDTEKQIIETQRKLEELEPLKAENQHRLQEIQELQTQVKPWDTQFSRVLDRLAKVESDVGETKRLAQDNRSTVGTAYTGTKPKTKPHGESYGAAEQEGCSPWEPTESRAQQEPQTSASHIEDEIPSTGYFNHGPSGTVPGFSPPSWEDLVMDKNEILRELYETIRTFKGATDSSTKKTELLKFYNRYHTYATSVADLMRMAPVNQRSALRTELDEVNAERANMPALHGAPNTGPRKSKHRIDPPQFNGDILSYHGWAVQWETYDDDPDYTPTEKYQLLCKSLTGPALNAAGNLPFSEANYQRMLSILKERFGAKMPVINQRRNLMRNAAMAMVGDEPSSTQLRDKFDGIQNHIPSLEYLGENRTSYDEEIANYVLRSLPEAITNKWRIGWGLNTRPNLDRVMQALTTEIALREAEEALRNSHVQIPVASANAVTTVKPRSQTPGSRSCAICDSKIHSTAYCFKGSLEERLATLTEQNRCHKCLKEGHSARSCTNGGKCWACKSTEHARVVCPVLEEENLYKEKNARGRSRSRSNQSNRSGSSQATAQGARAPTPTRQGSQSPSKATHPKKVTLPETTVANKIPIAQTNMNISILAEQQGVSPGMLPKFQAKVKRPNGKWLTVNGIIDTGSSNCFIRRATLKKLKHISKPRQTLRLRPFGNQEEILADFDIVIIELADRQGKATLKAKCLVQDFLQKVSHYTSTKLAQTLLDKGEELAFDPSTNIDLEAEIDIVIGTDQLASFMPSKRMEFGEDCTMAWHTHFGWAIAGGADKTVVANKITASMVGALKVPEQDLEISSLDIDFKAFWDLEHLGILPTENTEKEFLDGYVNSISQLSDGRYEVKYPFRDDKPEFDSCYSIALKRLVNLLADARFTQEQRVQYHGIFMSYLENGYIQVASPDEQGRTAYLPHRPVIREDAQTTKVRPVFDGSVHHRHRRSFNSNLEVGPNLNPDIMGIQLRWRRKKYAWIADIQQAFLQISIHPEHQEMVRFLWIDDPTSPEPSLVTYCWKRLSFGLTSSPFILRAVLLKHLQAIERTHPGISDRVLKQLYVDDWMGGENDLEEDVKLIRIVDEALKGTKMTLSKWVTSSQELIARLKGEIEFSTTPSMLARETAFENNTQKALGIIWDPVKDEFSFDPSKVIASAAKKGDKITKRQLFSLGLKIYDPLGLIAPVTLLAKIAMQKVWLDQTKWDQTVEPPRLPPWHKFIDGLKELETITIPRWTQIDENLPSEIHIFCDASEDAYGVVAYEIQVEKIALIAAKSRVVPNPKRSLSIPRLELLSNLIATTLSETTFKNSTAKHTKSLYGPILK